MTDYTLTGDLDGSTQLSYGGVWTFDWNGGGYSSGFFLFPNPADTVDADLTASGEWYMELMKFGETTDFTLIDGNDGLNRWIEHIQIGNLGNTVLEFKTLGVTTITGGADDSSIVRDLTFGEYGVGYINLWGSGSNTITTGTGYVVAVYLGTGDDTINVGSGGMGNVTIDGGNNAVVVSDFSDVDTIEFGSGMSSVTLGEGARVDFIRGTSGGGNTITAGVDSQIDAVRFSGGADTVTLEDGARIRTMRLGEDADTLTLNGSARVEFVAMGDGNDVVTLDSGNVGTVNLGGVNSHAQSRAIIII